MSATDRTEWLPGGLFETHRIERGIRGLFTVLGVYWRPFLASLLWACLNSGATMASFTLGAYIVGRSLQGTAADDLVPWIVALGVVVLIRALASWLESWIGHELAFRILAEIRGWLYRATARIAPGGLVRRRTGELASVALADAEALEVFYAHTSLYIFTTAVMTPLAVGVLAVFEPVVALMAGGLCLLTVAIPVLLRRLNQRSGAAVRSALADIHTFVVEHVGGLREILAFGRREAAGAELQRLTRRLVVLQMRHGARTGLEAAFTASVAGLGLVAAAWYSAARVTEGALDPALYPVVVVLAGQATLPALNLVGVTRHWGLTASAANRVFDLLEEPSPIERDGTSRVVGDGVPEVRVDDVTFTWPDADHPALIGVSVVLAPGESLAIVGHSGAGKSTLAALLARFFDPDRGRITVGGVSLAQLDPHEMSRLVSLVPQDVFLFHDTVRANLLLGSPSEDVSEAEMWAALEAANAASLIRSLPRGLDTVVGERGSALSGGERQRIALARTVLRGSPVLVLDESVSQLDVLSEHEIAEALRGVRKGRSTVIIAHRLSTVLAADRILLLVEGRVVASGTHRELLASCPEYLRLVGAQLSEAQPDPDPGPVV